MTWCRSVAVVSALLLTPAMALADPVEKPAVSKVKKAKTDTSPKAQSEESTASSTVFLKGPWAWVAAGGVGTVVPLVLMAFMASYSIVRGTRRVFGPVRSLFLLGLAIPVQATIVPIYLMIIRMHMYDSLVALMIPAIAFGLPLSILIISNSLRDVPRELFEAMDIDGSTEWQVFRRVTIPLLAPVLSVVFITMLINVLKVFDIVLAVAPASVQAQSNVIALAMWRTSFGGVNDFGLGSAIAVFLFLLVIPVLALNIRRFRREV